MFVATFPNPNESPFFPPERRCSSGERSSSEKSHLFKSGNKVFCIIDFLGWTSQGFTLLLYFRLKTHDLKKKSEMFHNLNLLSPV